MSFQEQAQISLPYISPSKWAFEKYKPWGLFSEFYGILLGTPGIRKYPGNFCYSGSWALKLGIHLRLVVASATPWQQIYRLEDFNCTVL